MRSQMLVTSRVRQAGVSQQAKLSLRDGEFSRGGIAVLPLECKREFISRAAQRSKCVKLRSLPLASSYFGHRHER